MQCWYFWNSTQNMLNFGLGCSYPLTILIPIQIKRLPTTKNILAHSFNALTFFCNIYCSKVDVWKVLLHSLTTCSKVRLKPFISSSVRSLPPMCKITMTGGCQFHVPLCLFMDCRMINGTSDKWPPRNPFHVTRCLGRFKEGLKLFLPMVASNGGHIGLFQKLEAPP